MKTIKEYLNENFFGNLGIGKKAQIEDWLKKYDIRGYTINPDLTIDVNENVNLAFVTFTNGKLPDYIRFNYVKKVFNICNTNLTSLEGAPKECKYFDCDGCKSLTSLEGAPNKCVNFYCRSCDNLTSLKGAPKECRVFSCTKCKNLTSLKGAPKECKEFYCRWCKGNFTEEDVKKVCNAKIIYCD